MSDEVGECQNTLYGQFFDFRDDINIFLSENVNNNHALRHILSKRFNFNSPISSKEISEGFNKYSKTTKSGISKEKWIEEIDTIIGDVSEAFEPRLDKLVIDIFERYADELEELVYSLIHRITGLKSQLMSESVISYNSSLASEKATLKVFKDKVKYLSLVSLKASMVKIIFTEDISKCEDLFSYIRGGVWQYSFSDIIRLSGLWEKSEFEKIEEHINSKATEQTIVAKGDTLKRKKREKIKSTYDTFISKNSNDFSEYESKREMGMVSAGANEKRQHQDWLLTGVETEVDHGLGDVEYQSYKEALKVCMEKLKDNQKMFIQGVFVNGQNNAHVAEVFDFSRAYVGQEINRALKSLEICLNKRVEQHSKVGE